jgi:hypothetical protein
MASSVEMTPSSKGAVVHASDVAVNMEGKKKDPAKIYDEAYMTLADLAIEHPDSNINAENPSKSLGLTSEDVKKRQLLYGKNSLTPPPSTPAWLLFLKQFLDVFMVLLTVSRCSCCLQSMPVLFVLILIYSRHTFFLLKYGGYRLREYLVLWPTSWTPLSP